MAQANKLATSGIAAVAANAIVGDTVIALTATGATQATALALTAGNNFVGTAAAGTGGILPTGNPGDMVFVYNGGSNALLVYPPVGGAVNNTAANTGFSVATLKSAIFVYSGAINSASLLSA